LIIVSLWAGVRELKTAGSPLRVVPAPDVKAVASSQAALPRASDGPALDRGLLDGEQPIAPLPSPTAWADDAAQHDPSYQDVPSPPVPEAPKLRRNLMFSSTSRKERERAQTRAGDVPAAAEIRSTTTAPAVGEAAPANFDDAWPKSERLRPPEPAMPRRSMRPPAAAEDQSEVTLLKSGVVDGMAYSLYSDGSIEAQLPEGVMRFASIDELRAHLDNRS
jgi:hypothetical protein